MANMFALILVIATLVTGPMPRSPASPVSGQLSSGFSHQAHHLWLPARQPDVHGVLGRK